MKLVLLIARAAGIAALLSFGAAGCGLASSAHTQAFVSDGTLAAKAMTARVSAAGGAPANLVNSADRSMCIDADSNHYPSNGDNIQLWACNTHPEQEWVVTSAGQLKNASTGMCIDADSNHYPSNGDNIQLWACNTHPEQEWVVTSAGQLKNASTGMCIDADSNHYPSNGDNIQLWACNTHPEQLWSITAAAQPDWAGSSFCAAYHVPYMGTTYKGVAACGVKYAGLTSNTQGKITHNGVMLDSVGFQCVELAARYFYYDTGHTPPGANGGGYAWAVYRAYPHYGISPGGATGGVGTYEASLVPGDIISMWSASDLTGHVAVVTKVSLNAAHTGTIQVIDENASATGVDTITVRNGAMSYSHYDEFQWVYNLP